MYEKLIRWSALSGLACVLASACAFVWRTGVYHCPVPDGCDVPVRASNHPHTDLGIALLVVGVTALGLAVELRRRATTDNSDSVTG
jgi:hypothetical protein